MWNSVRNLVLCLMCCFGLFMPKSAEAFMFTRSFSDDLGPVVGRTLDCASVIHWNDCFYPDENRGKRYRAPHPDKVYRALREREVQSALRQHMPVMRKPQRTIQDPRIRR